MRFVPDPQYYPSGLELTILVLMVIELLALGYLVRRYWDRNGEVMPPTVALALWVIMVGTFGAVIAVFAMANPLPEPTADFLDKYTHDRPVDPRIRLLLWGFFFWLIPMGYYISLLRESFGSYGADHLGPMSGAIEDPSEFADARRLALRGEIDRAIEKYRSYEHNRADALFEAARLLKSEDRFKEAAGMFEEIMANSPGNRRVWAEACYQLAKMKEVAFSDPGGAQALLRELLQRAPESRYGELASKDLARLQVLDDDFMNDDEPIAPVAMPKQDPFFSPTDVRVTSAAEKAALRVSDEDAAPIVDPFFALSQQNRAKVMDDPVLVQTDGGGNHSKPTRKPAARKPTPAAAKAPAAKALAAKKAPAKKASAKKPVAAKKPAARKSAKGGASKE